MDTSGRQPVFGLGRPPQTGHRQAETYFKQSTPRLMIVPARTKEVRRPGWICSSLTYNLFLRPFPFSVDAEMWDEVLEVKCGKVQLVCGHDAQWSSRSLFPNGCLRSIQSDNETFRSVVFKFD